MPQVLIEASFFGDQKGNFELIIKSVSAYKPDKEDPLRMASFSEKSFPFPYKDDSQLTSTDDIHDKPKMQDQQTPQEWLLRLFEACTQCVRLR